MRRIANRESRFVASRIAIYENVQSAIRNHSDGTFHVATHETIRLASYRLDAFVRLPRKFAGRSICAHVVERESRSDQSAFNQRFPSAICVALGKDANALSVRAASTFEAVRVAVAMLDERAKLRG